MYFPNAPMWVEVLCNDCITCQPNKLFSYKKKAVTQDFKGKSLYFNHKNSFETKGPITLSSVGNSSIIVVRDAFF